MRVEGESGLERRGVFGRLLGMLGIPFFGEGARMDSPKKSGNSN